MRACFGGPLNNRSGDHRCIKYTLVLRPTLRCAFLRRNPALAFRECHKLSGLRPLVVHAPWSRLTGTQVPLPPEADWSHGTRRSLTTMKAERRDPRHPSVG